MQTSQPVKLRIERVKEDNVEQYIELLERLALFEHLMPPDANAKERLRRELLGQSPSLEAYVVNADGEAIACLTLLTLYSTFAAKPVLYLEDIYVKEAYRKQGIGRRIMDFCLEQARVRGCLRVEWRVPATNRDAIAFYETIGARQPVEWVSYELPVPSGESSADNGTPSLAG